MMVYFLIQVYLHFWGSHTSTRLFFAHFANILKNPQKYVSVKKLKSCHLQK